MGIPFYFYVITQTHQGILSGKPPFQPAGIYFDFNGAIYQAVHKLVKNQLPLNNNSIASETIAYLDWLLKEGVAAGNNINVGVCLDGVAPRAKMMQQRKRRFMGMFRGLLDEKETSWDTCAISPGTEFMDVMAKYLRERAKGDKDMWVSPADEPGEGEHKIFQKLEEVPDTSPTLIYGLDADLIMLSLVSHRRNIYLMREVTQAGIPNNCPAVSANAPFVYVNIDSLRAGILENVRQHYKWPVSDDAIHDTYNNEAKQWIETYIVLCFLLGNDFLPPLPALTLKNEGLDIVLRAYGRIRKGRELVSDSKINWDVLAALIEDLSTVEDDRVHAACAANMERHCHAREPVEFYPSLPQNRDPVVKEILYSTGNWRINYYMGLFDIRRVNVPQVMRESTIKYLKGLCWVFNYYTRRPKDVMWFYPYGYAPTALDLVNTLQSENVGWDVGKQSDREFVDPVVQLLSILPPTSVNLLPPNARGFMQDDAHGCRHFYPSNFKVHTFLKTRLWECHPKLPILDVDWIENCWQAST